MKNKRRVAIIGGGIAGLVAAIELLALAPTTEILIFERNKHLGGRGTTLFKEGFYLNQGAHALYTDGALNRFLQLHGLEVSGTAPSQSDSLAYINRSFGKLPTDLVSLSTTNILNASEKLKLGYFFVELPKINTGKLMDVALADWLDNRFPEPTLAKLIESFVRLGTYAHSPARLSAGAAIEQMKLGFAGVRYLDHGWQSIVDVLEQALPDTVEKRLNLEVLSVEEVSAVSSSEVIVKTAEGVETVDFAILAVPPNIAETIAAKTLPANFSKSLVRARIACFDVCLSGLPQPSKTFALGLDQPLYFSVHSAAAVLTENGGALIQMGAYLDPQEQGDDSHLEMMTKMLDLLQPQWQEKLVYKRYLPNMVASFAIPLAERNGVAGVPSPALSARGRIFAVGDWVGSGHMLVDASTASALEAAKMIAHSVENLESTLSRVGG